MGTLHAGALSSDGRTPELGAKPDRARLIMAMIDEDWVNAGLAEAVAESVAKANKVTNVAPDLSPSPSPAPSKSLSTIGVNVRGGVIRNPTTKIKTQTDNPVANPRPSRDQRSIAGAKTVPAPDPLSELKASNPALAAPSLFTGMDVDVGRRTQPSSTIAAPPPPRQAPTPAPAMKEFQPTLDTTIRQLLEQARLQPDKIYHVVSDGRFMIKTELFTQESKAPV